MERVLKSLRRPVLESVELSKVQKSDAGNVPELRVREGNLQIARPCRWVVGLRGARV